MEDFMKEPLKYSNETTFYYAGFWLRFWALLIDFFVISMLFIFFATCLITTYHHTLFLIFVAALPFVLWLYSAGMESSSFQGTLGKMIIGIKVTDLEGKKISFLRATTRFFGKILSFLILGVGFLMVIWTIQQQALHDILADCLVIRSSPGSMWR